VNVYTLSLAAAAAAADDDDDDDAANWTDVIANHRQHLLLFSLGPRQTTTRSVTMMSHQRRVFGRKLDD